MRAEIPENLPRITIAGSGCDERGEALSDRLSEANNVLTSSISFASAKSESALIPLFVLFKLETGVSS